MKTMLLAAATALSLGIGSAYAAQGPADGYVYPDYIVGPFPTVTLVANSAPGSGGHLQGSEA
jgi:hypothetical protein